jgi:hypothetical protein
MSAVVLSSGDITDAAAQKVWDEQIDPGAVRRLLDHLVGAYK